MISKKMIGKIAFFGGSIYIVYLVIKAIKLYDFSETSDQITIGALTLTGLIFMYRSIKYLFEKSDKKDR